MKKTKARLGQLNIEFDLMLKEQHNPDRKMFNHHTEIFILLARTVTFVMQKELRHLDWFNAWYQSKQVEMKSLNFDEFIRRRNIIEKEGNSVIGGGEVTIMFGGNPQDPNVKAVGEIIDKNGNKKVVMGTMEHKAFFKSGENKSDFVIDSCNKYLEYLTRIVKEAESKIETPISDKPSHESP